MKGLWDLLMTVVLLTSCVITPIDIAFRGVGHDKNNEGWLAYAIDILFLIDMFITFNSATQNKEGDLLENRKKIAKVYLQGWFTIDLIAIVPFDLLFTKSDVSSMARITRIGRLYKLAKLFKLFRVLKLMKDQSKLLKQIHLILKIGAGFERLFFFMIVFFLCTHIGACLWLIMASLQQDFYKTKEYKDTWLEPYFKDDKSSIHLYGIAFYWTIQTISTVGYGDVSITNNAERVFCAVAMVLGVVAFGIANG